MRTMKINLETGSLINMFLSSIQKSPSIGIGATILGYTDRKAYEVIEVSKDKKKCIIQRYAAKRIDSDGMGDSQTYEYKEMTEEKMTLVYKWGSWRTSFNDGNINIYNKVNIVFGILDEYFDYSF